MSWVSQAKIHKGRFSKKAEDRGLSAVEFAKRVLQRPESFDLQTRREAQFYVNINSKRANDEGLLRGGSKKRKIDTRVQDYEESIKQEENAMKSLVREFDEHEARLATLRKLRDEEKNAHARNNERFAKQEAKQITLRKLRQVHLESHRRNRDRENLLIQEGDSDFDEPYNNWLLHNYNPYGVKQKHPIT